MNSVKRQMLLKDETAHEEQLLETDVMRFLAIMGIVFWIIFALIKSIPFQKQELDSTHVNHEVETHVSPANYKNRNKNSAPREKILSHVDRKDEKPASEPQSAPERHQKGVSQPESVSPGPDGVQIQFYSLEDLIELLNGQRVRLFCRVQAAGFDLFFEGNSRGDDIRFRKVTGLPSTLWEIKSGKDHAHFLALMSSSHPAIRSFPVKQVLVAFADETLDKRVGHTFDRLTREGKSGILSITYEGEIIYSQDGK
jgi:hypothetical protein